MIEDTVSIDSGLAGRPAHPRCLPSDGQAQFIQLDLPFGSSEPQVAKRQDGGAIVLVPEDEQEIDYISGLPQAGLQFGGWIGNWQFPLVNGSCKVRQTNQGIYGLVSVPCTVAGLALDGRLWANAVYGFMDCSRRFSRFPTPLPAAGWARA